jgi:hypothetical protein
MYEGEVVKIMFWKKIRTLQCFEIYPSTRFSNCFSNRIFVGLESHGLYAISLIYTTSAVIFTKPLMFVMMNFSLYASCLCFVDHLVCGGQDEIIAV